MKPGTGCPGCAPAFPLHDIDAQAKRAVKISAVRELADMRGISHMGEWLERLDIGHGTSWVVGHDTVDAPFEKTSDVDRLVHDPNVHFHVELMNGVDDGFRNDPSQAFIFRHLERGARCPVVDSRQGLRLADGRENLALRPC